MEQCEQLVMELENEKTKLEAKLATPEGAADATLFEAYNDIQQKLTEAELAWEEALEQLES